jgi:hypothetical protein
MGGGNDASGRFASYRVGVKRIFVDALYDPKLTSWFGSVSGFVNVSRHIGLFLSYARTGDHKRAADCDLRDVLRSRNATLLQQACRLFQTESMFANNRTDGVCNLGVSHDFVKLVCAHR